VKLKSSQIHALAKNILKELKAKSGVHLKMKEELLLQEMEKLLTEENQKLLAIEQEAKKMLDTLVAQNPSIDSGKMFFMLKNRLAKEKGIPL